MRYKLESTLTVGGGAVLKNLDCEWQKFLLAHRRWGTFRETSLCGDELGETSAVRRLEKLRGNETVRVSFVEEILPKIQVRGIFRIRGIRRNVLPKFIEICIETPCWCPSVNLVKVGRREPWERGCPSGWINSYVVWIFVTSYENCFGYIPYYFQWTGHVILSCKEPSAALVVIHISFCVQNAFPNLCSWFFKIALRLPLTT